MLQFKYKSKFDLREYDFIFKGGYYKAEFIKYTDCIRINQILFICNSIEIKKNKPCFINRILKNTETEYKQISELLKREEGVLNEYNEFFYLE